MTVTDRTDATDEEFRARFDRFGIFDEERVVEEVARAQRFSDTAMRCLDRALAAMNHAIELTRDHGPAVGMESIADFLNDTDGIDEEVADTMPDNWLTRWTVVDLTAVDVDALDVVREPRCELVRQVVGHSGADAGVLA